MSSLFIRLFTLFLGLTIILPSFGQKANNPNSVSSFGGEVLPNSILIGGEPPLIFEEEKKAAPPPSLPAPPRPKPKKSIVTQQKVVGRPPPPVAPPPVVPPPPKPPEIPVAPAPPAIPKPIPVAPPPPIEQVDVSTLEVVRLNGLPYYDTHSPSPERGKAAIESITATYPMDLTRVWPLSKSLRVILHNRISSQTSGKVIGTVQNHLYGGDGKDGNLILIPKGSMAVGFYNANLQIGDEVLNIVWYRIEMPDGRYLDFGESAFLEDLAGNAGLGGKVDKKVIERYFNALLFSSVQYAILANIPSTSSKTVNPESIAANQAINNVVGVTTEILRDSLTVKPVVTIEAGSIVNIAIKKAVYFPPLPPGAKAVQVVEVPVK